MSAKGTAFGWAAGRVAARFAVEALMIAHAPAMVTTANIWNFVGVPTGVATAAQSVAGDTELQLFAGAAGFGTSWKDFVPGLATREAWLNMKGQCSRQ